MKSNISKLFNARNGQQWDKMNPFEIMMSILHADDFPNLPRLYDEMQMNNL